MRALKFRQPLFYLGKFIKWHYWGHIKGGFQAPVAGDLERKSQQYIGRKDKTGKEICAGDICNYENLLGVHTGTIKYRTKYSAFRLMFEQYKELGEVWVDLTENIEIIGNIIENPNLLKGD